MKLNEFLIIIIRGQFIQSQKAENSMLYKDTREKPEEMLGWIEQREQTEIILSCNFNILL